MIKTDNLIEGFVAENELINKYLKIEIMPILDQESLDFIGRAFEKTRNVDELSVMFDSPREFAEYYQLELHEYVEERLWMVGERRRSLPFPPDDPVNRDVVSFFNTVVIDGRFIREWFHAPGEIAGELGVQVSNEVLYRIEEVYLADLVDVDEALLAPALAPIAIGVIVKLVIIVVETVCAPPAYLMFSIEPVIIDRTTLDKV